MSSPASEIAALLNDSRFGLLLAGPSATTGNLFVSRLPESPDAAVAVKDSPSLPPLANLSRTANWERPGVQIIVRGARGDYETAWALACLIARTFHQKMTWTAQCGDVYKGCFLASSPLYLGHDDRERPLFSLNFNLAVAWA